jgi:hypothetical protein
MNAVVAEKFSDKGHQYARAHRAENMPCVSRGGARGRARLCQPKQQGNRAQGTWFHLEAGQNDEQ